MIPLTLWLSARSPWQRWLMAFVGGIFVTLALPPVYATPLMLLAFPLFILLIDGAVRLRTVVGLGWLFGAGHMLSGLYWVGNALAIAGAPPALAMLLPLSMAFYPALGAVLYWVASRWLISRGWMHYGDALALALFAICWLVGEWLRGHLFTGFPWNLVGYSWAFSDIMSQPAALFGAYGLSFVTVLVAATPLTLVGCKLKFFRSWVPVASGTLVLIAMFAFGFNRLSMAGDTDYHDLRIRIVQSNIDQKDKWRPDLRADNFIRHLILSEKQGAEKVDLLIWPETAVPYYLDEDPGRTVMMGRIIKPEGMILTGVPRREILPDRTRKYYNSLLAIEANGAVTHTFDKFHLVPFGEYVPFHDLLKQLGFEKVVEGAGDFTPGPGPRVLDLPGMPSVGPLICYEVIFPGNVVPAGERPGFLLNVTNDAWYGKTTGPYQHLMITRFRAIEEGLPILRAAGTGISAIIDGYGRVVRQLGLGKAGTVDGKLPKAIVEPTFFALWHNWTVVGLVLIMSLCVMTGHAVARRNKTLDYRAKPT